MRTSLTRQYLDSAVGREADSILRKCVHCGFCNATCPTYQLTGDELDGPRGRIYQIKQVLEGDTATARTQLHLDRCLTCRNCETTCPSGVHYSRLLDTGRQLVEQSVQRSRGQRLQRTLLRYFLLSPWFGRALGIGRLLRPLLPGALQNAVPRRNPVPGAVQQRTHTHRVLLVGGCVQRSLQPSIDAAAVRVFDRLGIETVHAPSAGCCGALEHHLSAETAGLDRARANIDSWLPLLEDGSVEAITMTASGCGVMIRDYRYLFQHDADYADKARRISAAYRDPVEILAGRDSSELKTAAGTRIAFHPPCTLQHGQGLGGEVERLLTGLGYELLAFDDSHLCCGSAGTYSITQKELSRQLRERKLGDIGKVAPEIIVTANIGCQTHLQGGTDTPVRHWLELLT